MLREKANEDETKEQQDICVCLEFARLSLKYATREDFFSVGYLYFIFVQLAFKRATYGVGQRTEPPFRILVSDWCHI